MKQSPESSGGWHKAATFAVGIVPPVVLLLAYIVASCRSQWKRGAAQVTDDKSDDPFREVNMTI